MNDIVKTIEKIIDKKNEKQSPEPYSGTSTGSTNQKTYNKIGNFTI